MDSTAEAPAVTGSAAGGGAGSASSRRRAGKRRASGVVDAATTAATQRGGDGPIDPQWIYEARRPLKVGTDIFMPGDRVPAKIVESWPRPESYVRTGKLVRRPKIGS